MGNGVVFKRCFAHRAATASESVMQESAAVSPAVSAAAEAARGWPGVELVDGRGELVVALAGAADAAARALPYAEVVFNVEPGKVRGLDLDDPDALVLVADFLRGVRRRSAWRRLGVYGLSVRDNFPGLRAVEHAAAVADGEVLRARLLAPLVDVVDCDGYLHADSKMPGWPLGARALLSGRVASLAELEGVWSAAFSYWAQCTEVMLERVAARWDRPVRLWVGNRLVGGLPDAAKEAPLGERLPPWLFDQVLKKCAEWCDGGAVESVVVLLGWSDSGGKQPFDAADARAVATVKGLMAGRAERSGVKPEVK